MSYRNNITPLRDEARFWEYVDFSLVRWAETSYDCWLWLGGMNKDGYGQFRAGNKTLVAHKWSYEHFIEKVPDGLVLDHLCRTRHCVNPEHLEPVVNQENILRGYGYAGQNARKTHCKWGHEFTPENTISNHGGRGCRICKNKSSLDAYYKRKGRD